MKEDPIGITALQDLLFFMDYSLVFSSSSSSI